jgi:hypothetical protein
MGSYGKIVFSPFPANNVNMVPPLEKFPHRWVLPWKSDAKAQTYKTYHTLPENLQRVLVTLTRGDINVHRSEQVTTPQLVVKTTIRSWARGFERAKRIQEAHTSPDIIGEGVSLDDHSRKTGVPVRFWTLPNLTARRSKLEVELLLPIQEGEQNGVTFDLHTRKSGSVKVSGVTFDNESAISTEKGDVALTGSTSDENDTLPVDAKSGDISVYEHTGGIAARTESGGITFERCNLGVKPDIPMVADSVYGPIVFQTVGGRTRARSRFRSVTYRNVKGFSHNVSSIFGGIDMQGVRGGIDATNHFRKILGRHLRGNIRLQNAFGRTDVSHINTDSMQRGLCIDSKIGRVKADDVHGNVEVRTMGNIDVHNATIWDYNKLSSVLGNIHVTLRKSEVGIWANSRFGRIRYSSFGLKDTYDSTKDSYNSRLKKIFAERQVRTHAGKPSNCTYSIVDMTTSRNISFQVLEEK